MKYRLILAAAAALMLAAPAAHAQAGVPAPGICVLDRDAMFSTSLAGKSIGDQLRTMASASDTALKAERATIEKDVVGFRSLQATLPADQRQARAGDLQKRADALDVKAATAQREIQGGEVKALQSLLAEASPLVDAEAAAQKCGVVLDVKAIFSFNNPPSMNLTKAVIEKLDAKIKTITVTRATTTAPAKK
ncbi:MAG: OmpH family outer membrane protein [Alphaproteobacteria bacterium]